MWLRLIASVCMLLSLNSHLVGAPPVLQDNQTDLHEVQSEESPDVWRDANHCGVNCTYVFTRLLGRTISYDEICANLANSGKGTSLAAIATFAGEHGVPVRILKSTRRQLQDTQMPVIALLERDKTIGHFVVILSIREDIVEVVDGTAGAIVAIPSAVFFREWNGHLLSPYEQSMAATFSSITLIGAGITIMIFTYLFSSRQTESTK